MRGQIDINLRNALFYEEKRPFFLEGKENFEIGAVSSGETSALKSIVNTRTIVDPLLGLKLNGKLGDRNVVSGIFALDESPESTFGTGSENEKNAAFTILRYKRTLNKDSYIGGFYSGRGHDGDSNRITGIDGRFRLNGKSTLEYNAIASFDKQSGDYSGGSTAAVAYDYKTRRLAFGLGFRNISQNFKADTGYYTRTGISQLPMRINYSFFPKSKLIQQMRLVYSGNHNYDHETGLWGTYNFTGVDFYFPRQSFLWFGRNHKREVFAGQVWNINDMGGGFGTQILKQLYLSLYVVNGRRIFYDPQAPYSGKSLYLSVSATWQPTSKFRSSLDLTYSDFFRHSDNSKVYDYSIVRNRTTFQFNKYLYLRSIVEYNSYHKRIQADLLASFTYIPGTVIQAGYGSVYEKLRWEHERYIPANDFLHTRRHFFLKASYLWRL